MLKQMRELGKIWMVKTKSFLMTTLGKGLIHLLIFTCRIHIEGLERFCELAAKERCILMFWHNRLALAPYILSQFTPQFLFAALVSGSRDGAVLTSMIHSYANGRTIRVPHQARYQALREIVRDIEERKQIVIITPDGPRGPRYSLKPGIAVAALETNAHVVSFNWEAKSYWELKTWDRLRLPKPFTTIRVTFNPSLRFDQTPIPTLDQAKEIIKKALPAH